MVQQTLPCYLPDVNNRSKLCRNFGLDEFGNVIGPFHKKKRYLNYNFDAIDDKSVFVTGTGNDL